MQNLNKIKKKNGQSFVLQGKKRYTGHGTIKEVFLSDIRVFLELVFLISYVVLVAKIIEKIL